MGNIGLAKRGAVFFLGMCAWAAAAPGVLAADSKAANEKVLQQARASYYSLQREGLAQFKCGVVSNWEKMLAGMRKTNPEEADRRAKIFSGIRFEFTQPIGGETKVSHSYTGEEHPEMASNFNQIFQGTEQTIAGFFSTWSGFVVTPFLPDASDNYKLVKDHGQYRVTSEEGEVKVLALMDQNLEIKKVRVTTKAFDSTILTQFSKVQGGYLLTGYDATYASPSQGVKGGVKVGIDYQVVDGFQIPKVLHINGASGGSPFLMELSFVDCQVTRRSAPAALPAQPAK